MRESLNERLNKILPRVISDEFLSCSGIGNEIAFYIFDYAPEEELQVRDFLRTLLDHLPKQKHGLRVKHMDLFDFVIAYLKSRNLLDKALKMQHEKGDEALKKALAGPLHETKMSGIFAEAAREPNLTLLVARVRTSYEVFANGQTIGTLGGMPPRARLVDGVNQVFSMSAVPAGRGNSILVAIRVWHPPHRPFFLGGGSDQPFLIGDGQSPSRMGSVADQKDLVGPLDQQH